MISLQVSRGERKVVFQTGFEQAQQQFAAAQVVGYESRPLNLFYGLAQAGKALAAASPHLGQSQSDDAFKTWRTSSHGLAFDPEGSDFWGQKVRVLPARSDSFSRASIAVDSARDIGSIELGALAAQIPEFLEEWPAFGRWPRSIDMSYAMGADRDRFLLHRYSGALALQDVEAHAAHYPSLAGSTVEVDENGDPKIEILLDGGHPCVVLPSGRPRVWPNGTRKYGRLNLVLPRAGNATTDLHPVMAWWLLLFGFSILARYHPKEWTGALALGESPIASQVEFLLDAALTSVPELLARELLDTPWYS